MKVIVGMATFAGREDACEQAVESLSNQVDDILLWDNSEEGQADLADNGKFAGLSYINEDCYYLTCDDDILYPEDYVETMVKAIERTDAIVTHHGRILGGLNLDYYTEHLSFRCLDAVGYPKLIDVCGTGVTGFKTSVFNPVGLAHAEDKKMSDLIFSLAAAHHGTPILLQPHEKGWIKQLDIDHRTSIFETERKNKRQIEIANEIYNLRR